MDDEDLFGLMFLVGLFVVIAVATASHMPWQLYIALLFAVTELVYIQIISLEDKKEILNLKNTDMMLSKALNIKFISLLLAVIIIPIIAILMWFAYTIIMMTKFIITLILVAISVTAIIYLYLFINTIPIRFRKKLLEKEKTKKPKKRKRSK